MTYPSPTPTEKGVWDLQQVRDKQLLGTGQWKYDAPSAPSGLFVVGSNREGILGGNFGAPRRQTLGEIVNSKHAPQIA